MERYFEWDTKKAEINFRKHGIRFEEAARVFDNPFAISQHDQIENGEHRWKTIGMACGGLLLRWRTRYAGKMRTSRLYASSVPVAWTETNGGGMSMVRYKQGKLPPLTEERQTEVKALAEQRDDKIDYSDIPPLDESFWASAVPNPFFKPIKTHASVRIDADVLAWLKSQGKGYQTRMNSILREAMLRSMHHKS